MEPQSDPYRDQLDQTQRMNWTESGREGSQWTGRRRPPGRAARRWLVIGGLALAFALVLGIGMVIGAATQPSAQAASFTPGNAGAAQGPQFPGFPGDRQGPFAGTPGAQGPGQCDALTVTSVTGSTIVATAQDGSSVTIHTTSSTTYTTAGQAATASAVTVGVHIHVDGTKASDGSISATRIDVQ